MPEADATLLTTTGSQFCFKKGVSCSSAIYPIRSIVDKFTAGGSTVDLYTIDLSKAFDKMNRYGLLIKLMNIKLPINIQQILKRWFDIYLFIYLKSLHEHCIYSEQ